MCLLISILIFVNLELQSSTQNRKILIPRKSLFFSLIAKNYPSEILDGRLYLGDQFHTADKQIMNHLRITHILNISDMIPNYFEESSKIDSAKENVLNFGNVGSVNIKYLRINIEDHDSV